MPRQILCINCLSPYHRNKFLVEHNFFVIFVFKLGDKRFINAAIGALEGLWKSRSKLGLVN